jgi:rhodanese-related sulfurtransferase
MIWGTKEIQMSLMDKLFKTFSKGTRITAQQADEALKAGQAVLVDVREADELQAEGIAVPALWLATSEIADGTEKSRKFIESLPRDKLIVIYCKAGVRAGRFAEQLTGLGFNTSNLGGFNDWTAAKLPTKKWTN